VGRALPGLIFGSRQISTVGSCHAPGGESGQRFVMREVGLDYQFHRRDAIQIDFIIFQLAGRSGRAEIPLLPYDLFGLPAIRRRPSNGEFLQAVARWLQKMKLYSMYCDGLVEDEADLLFAFLSRSPAWTAVGIKDGFDGKAGILGRNFDGCDLSQIHPARTRPRLGSHPARSNNSLSHLLILSHPDV